MASIILRDVGSAVGNAILPGIGGAFLGTLGRSLGGLIDSKLGLGASYQGPQLQNLSVQDSRYGAGMPLTYGEMRVAGNVIWSTDLMQTQHTSSFSGGKGGGGSVSTTTYTYSVHCAVGIASGPVGGITTIWADSNIVYQDGVWVAGVVDSATIYTGASGQAPDPFMQSMLGSGNVPAYKGLAYVVLENLQLANFGNRLPNLTFEIAPSTTTSNPSFLGSVDASLSQSPQASASGGITPIILSNDGGSVSSVLIGGFIASGSTCIFEVAEYDVSGQTPVQLARASSASFASNDPLDISWALGPDGNTVALYLENGSPLADHFLALYDIETRQFGAIATPTIAVSTLGMRQITWIDAQHFLIDDIVGGVRGVHVFTRAGLNIVDLGFTGVWGSGSSTSRLPMNYAQFIPYAGGLLTLATDASGPYFSAIYACALLWQNNALVVGAPYAIASGLSVGSGSGPSVNIMQTGASEWTLCFATTVDFHLISFEPAATSATVTRPWQDFTNSFGLGTTTLPLYYGDRLVLIQHPFFSTYYCISEVMLGSGSFTLSLTAVPVTGGASYSYFGGIALDSSRFLLQGAGGFNWDIQQLGIFQRCPTGDGLDAVMSDILTRAGYASGDFDVSALAGTTVDGYVLQGPMPARAAIEPLQAFYPFDLVETAAELKAVPRGGSAVATIPCTEWRAAMDKKDPPPPLEVTRAQELDLPLEIDVSYIDASRDFEVNSQRARRIAAPAQAVQSLELPMVIDSDTAKQIAEVRLYSMWAERELVQLSVSRAWLMIDPSDVIDLGNGSQLRVTTVNQAGGLMQIQGFYSTPAVYASLASADAGQSVERPGIAVVVSTLYLMDIPLLQATDDQAGVYAAVTGLPGWVGASLWRSADGVNYNDVASLSSAAIAGIAVTALPNQPCLYIDNLSTVEVQLIQGTLSSCTLLQMYNGANAAMLGNEIIQFQTATLIGPGLYSLSNLLRGRRGTEFTSASHVIGESFVMLTPGEVDFVPALLTDRGQSYDFRALSNGQTLGAVQDTDFTYGLATIRPFSPVNLSGTRLAGTSGDLTLIWNRRARLNAEWVDFIDVPLDEPVELYDVEIMNGSSVMRTFYSVPSPTVVYTAVDQTADWGSGIPAHFTINVYQISSRYGRGEVCTSTV